MKLTVEILNGKLLGWDLIALNKQIKTLPDGKYLLSVEKPKRTISQNELLWKWCKVLSDFNGDTQQEWYLRFCRWYLPIDKTYYDYKGEVAGGTSHLNKKEFSEFLERIQAFAATEFPDVELPTPNDPLFEDFLKRY